jgi:hypothetical protein
MRKFLILCAAAAALGLVAVTTPADAATRKSQAVTAGQAVQIDLSARRRHRRYVYRYGPRYRYYYARPYYYAYPHYYYYGPRYYYYPYGYYYYYQRPVFYFGFGF